MGRQTQGKEKSLHKKEKEKKIKIKEKNHEQTGATRGRQRNTGT